MTKHHVFKENLTKGEHQLHSEYKLPVLTRLGNLVAIAFLIVVMILWPGIPLAHSADESPQKATSGEVSYKITPGVVENKIKDISKRIKVSESAENDHIAQQLGVSLFDLQARTAKLRDINATWKQAPQPRLKR